MFPDADMIVKGDNHQKIFDPNNMREKIDVGLNVGFKEGYHLRCGPYSQKTKSGFGWAVQKGFPAVKLGGWAVDLSMKFANNGNIKKQIEVKEL